MLRTQSRSVISTLLVAVIAMVWGVFVAKLLAKDAQLKADWERMKAETEAAKRDELNTMRDEFEEKTSRAKGLEAAKWQKAIKDAEVKMEAEKQGAWRRGMEERDKLAAQEAAQLKAAAAKALEEVKASAKKSLEGAMQDAEEAAKQMTAEETDEAAGEDAAAMEAEMDAVLEEMAEVAEPGFLDLIDVSAYTSTGPSVELPPQQPIP